eukprot:TRINITY_DN74818_c0_g1_i1.p1 TRINITY_DN74818_c0_g1~~TRINITY_DN74818_c0_g1_i1.p1  ORF type:complete len:402 (+),score=64.70 TRINITY_DN74818_c0_g1_i1:112-1317(+)
MAAEKVAGEWIVVASILQCEDAFGGRVHFTESGELVYLPHGAELIGRGVGCWVAEGPVIGFQIDVFQYAATSVKHVPNEPHRFRAVALVPPSENNLWVGEWYFLAYQQPPRLVGKFKAHRRNAMPDLANAPRHPPDCPAAAKKAVIAKLDKMCEPPDLLQPRWRKHIVQSSAVEYVHYVPNWLDATQVAEAERTIDRSCDWEHMATRDTQEFGCSSRCPCGRSLMREVLPQWQQTYVNALHNLGVFHPVLYPANSVRLNAYTPGQGIYPHLDGPVYYPGAAIISLGSGCLFDFYSRVDLDEEKRGFSWDRDKEVPAAPELPPGTKPAFSLFLEPGSLLVFSGDAFIHHRHGINSVECDEIHDRVKNAGDIGLSVGDRLKRDRRVSLTIRHLLPRCNCSSIA